MHLPILPTPPGSFRLPGHSQYTLADSDTHLSLGHSSAPAYSFLLTDLQVHPVTSQRRNVTCAHCHLPGAITPNRLGWLCRAQPLVLAEVRKV